MPALGDDPLAEVARLPGVADAMAAARAALDPLLLDRRLRKHGPALAHRVQRRNAHASATLEGAEVPIEELGQPGASPLLRVANGVLDVMATLPTLAGTPARQAWAALAVIASREYVTDDRRGRPRQAGEELHDPLHLGLAHDPEDAAVRLAMLAELLARPTAAPALVVAAVAHGELLALQPFGAGNGVVARAYSHLLLAQRSTDPQALCMSDVGLLSLGRAAYVRAIQAYDAGGDGVAAWCAHLALAFERGALLTRQALEDLAA